MSGAERDRARRRARMPLVRLAMLLSLTVAALAAVGALALAARDEAPPSPPPLPTVTAPAPPPETAPTPGGAGQVPTGGRGREPPDDLPRIEWKRSVAIGSPSAGRLVRGVRLPPEGRDFFTWDPVKRRAPNRWWRRYGTDRLVRLVLRIAREYRDAHPGAPRMAVGDLSRPRGGDFGPQFGYIGHASHQNGLDVDVYYPRADARERAPRYASQIDPRLSQDLVDRFVAAGAVTVFVGPNTKLTGPPGVVVPLINHDNHLHVRIR